MNALTLLVDAANAESKSTAPDGVSSAAEEKKNGKNQTMSTSIDREKNGTIGAAPGSAAPGLPIGALPGGANTVAAALAARENAMYQQIQQQQGAAAKFRYLEEIRKEEEQLSKERLATIMLQREREQQQQAAVQQAAIMRLIGSGSPSAATTAAAVPPPGIDQSQEAEYLQQLRLEALVQQRRQETLAKLTEMESTSNNFPGAPTAKTGPKGVISHKYQRQDTALQKAILMARADEELRKQQFEQHQKVQEQREIEQQLEHEHHRQKLQLMANGDNSSAFVKALRAATGSTRPQYPTNGSGEDGAILQILEERERQRLRAQHLPQSLPSSAQFEIQQQFQHHLKAQQPGGSQGERTDLIRAAVAAASNYQSNPHQPQMPSQVLSAIAAAEEQEKQKLLQLQLHRQNNQESFQSSGMMLDAQQQHHQQLRQQALVHQQQQAAALVQQQQESMKMNQESVERDSAFHDSKSTILPCRARGMPMDHNVKTAYFVIPQNIKHGTELLCSYFACRNAGIKFRYCVYCKLPVAKRNFAKRHRHSGKIPESDIAKDGAAESAPDSALDDEPPPMCTIARPLATEEKKEVQDKKPNPEEKATSCDTKVEPSSEEAPPKSPGSLKKTDVPSETDQVTSDPSKKIASTIRGDNSEKSSCPSVNGKEAPTLGPEAAKLTQKSDAMVKDPKPTEPANVNNLSSMKDAPPVCVSPKPTNSTSKRRKAWEDLLLQRPKTKRPNSDAMTAWIQAVLRVSDFEVEIDSDESGVSDAEVQANAKSPANGVKNGKIDNTRPSSAKKSKTKALLSRKVQEDMEKKKVHDENSDGDSNAKSDKLEHSEEEIPKEDNADKETRKRNHFPDDASTSSEESVDLRIQKKARN